MEFLNLLEKYLGWCIGYVKELKEKEKQKTKKPQNGV